MSASCYMCPMFLNVTKAYNHILIKPMRADQLLGKVSNKTKSEQKRKNFRYTQKDKGNLLHLFNHSKIQHQQLAMSLNRENEILTCKIKSQPMPIIQSSHISNCTISLKSHQYNLPSYLVTSTFNETLTILFYFGIF